MTRISCVRLMALSNGVRSRMALSVDILHVRYNSYLLYRSFSEKSFKAQDNLLVRNYSDSFQQWILNMFRSNPKYSCKVFTPSKVDAVTKAEIKDLDIQSLLNVLWTKKLEEVLTPMALRNIDDELCSKIGRNSPAEDLLNCLQVYMTVAPIQTAKLKAFKHALIHLETNIKKSSLSAHDLVQATYYASHLKTSVVAKRFMPLALYKMDSETLNALSVTDLGVFCVSLFRASVPIEKPKLIEYLAERFKSEITSLLENDAAIFVSFVKCFRISKYYDAEMTNFISSQGLGMLSNLDIVAKIHLAVYFAAAQHCDTSFISAFYTTCIEEVNEKVAACNAPRMKDLNNLLWSCGVYNMKELNIKIEKSEIPKYIQENLCLLRKDKHTQVSLLLWLWICEVRLEREVTRYLTMENAKYITDSKNFKSVANLFLLLSMVQIESPGLLKSHIVNFKDNRLQPRFEQYINKRPCLKTLLSTVQQYSAFLQLDNVRFAFPVPALYIGSIYAEFAGKPISIEVNDPPVCLTNSDQLLGRMKLKLRLLNEMGIPFLQVPGSMSYDLEDLRKKLRHTSCTKSASDPLENATGG